MLEKSTRAVLTSGGGAEGEASASLHSSRAWEKQQRRDRGNSKSVRILCTSFPRRRRAGGGEPLLRAGVPVKSRSLALSGFAAGQALSQELLPAVPVWTQPQVM